MRLTSREVIRQGLRYDDVGLKPLIAQSLDRGQSMLF